jgi:protein phosphatase
MERRRRRQPGQLHGAGAAHRRPAADRLRDNIARLHLPLPPRLKPGQQLDGLTVDALLHESIATLLYRVRDARAARVLKTLRPEHDDPEAAALAHEEWLARR